jgi:hypothetical protein
MANNVRSDEIKANFAKNYEYKIVGNGRVLITDPETGKVVKTIDSNMNPTAEQWNACLEETDNNEKLCGSIYTAPSKYFEMDNIMKNVDPIAFGVIDYTQEGISNSYSLLKRFAWLKDSSSGKVISYDDWVKHFRENLKEEQDDATKIQAQARGKLGRKAAAERGALNAPDEEKEDDEEFDPPVRVLPRMQRRNDDGNVPRMFIPRRIQDGGDDDTAVNYPAAFRKAVEIVNNNIGVLTGTKPSYRTPAAAANRARYSAFRSNLNTRPNLYMGLGHGVLFNSIGRQLGGSVYGLSPSETTGMDMTGGAYPSFDKEHPVVTQLKKNVDVFGSYLRGRKLRFADKTRNEYIQTLDDANRLLQKADEEFYTMTQLRLTNAGKGIKDNMTSEQLAQLVKNYKATNDEANRKIHKFRVFINGLASTIAIENVSSDNQKQQQPANNLVAI